MTVTEVLAALAGRGIKLRRVGDKLRLRPKDLVTPELAALLIEHKASLLGLLANATTNERAERQDAAQSLGAQPAAEECESSPRIAPGGLPQVNESCPADGWPDRATIPIDEVEPCAKCRRIEHWEDGLGNWKCRRCQPPKWSGEALWNTAERLRGKRNHGRGT